MNIWDLLDFQNLLSKSIVIPHGNSTGHPYKTDPKRDPNLENDPYVRC